MANTTKTTPEEWLETAKHALIKDGVAGVKVDRLAKTLGVTRGGFYHHFKNQQDLIDQLVQHWVATNDMVPSMAGVSNPAEAADKLQELVQRVILEEDFSPSFDLAIREWARVDACIKNIVDRVDAKRIRRLKKLFLCLGCDEEEAPIRARVFYFHQIGYYTLGYHERQARSKRLLAAPIYLRILCGEHYIRTADSANPEKT